MTSEPTFSLLTPPSECGTLVGAVLPPDPETDGTVVLTSSVTHRVFPAEDRDAFEWLCGIRPWTQIQQLFAQSGADDGNLQEFCDEKLILRLPAQFTVTSFMEAFMDYALVSTTAVAVDSVADDHAILTSPDSGGRRVSRLFYELLRRSDGSRNLTRLVIESCSGDYDTHVQLTEEICRELPEMLLDNIVAIVKAE